MKTPLIKASRHYKTAKVKKMLEQGKKLQPLKLDRMLNVTNSPEIIRRLRDTGMDIVTDWKVNKTTGNRYGEYRLVM